MEGAREGKLGGSQKVQAAAKGEKWKRTGVGRREGLLASLPFSPPAQGLHVQERGGRRDSTIPSFIRRVVSRRFDRDMFPKFIPAPESFLAMLNLRSGGERQFAKIPRGRETASYPPSRERACFGSAICYEPCNGGLASSPHASPRPPSPISVAATTRLSLRSVRGGRGKKGGHCDRRGGADDDGPALAGERIQEP